PLDDAVGLGRVMAGPHVSQERPSADVAAELDAPEGGPVVGDDDDRRDLARPSACDDADCVGSGFARLDFTYDGEGRRTQIVETPPLGPAITRTFRYQGDAIVQELVDGTVVRDYVTTDAGTIVKVIVPGGADAGTY